MGSHFPPISHGLPLDWTPLGFFSSRISASTRKKLGRFDDFGTHISELPAVSGAKPRRSLRTLHKPASASPQTCVHARTQLRKIK
ncbi:hypothetical protein RvY_00837-2 [Ramazzottius varieornatus]|uniref:Uncharacterized protein n=1 Tax=Ramazzottius varieornatus TaxID=947166 RepID=A0A1D1UI69_RAMVA|nr:hypothetical protein RvY_00837-2 [Ramazzottius varieornatus]